LFGKADADLGLKLEANCCLELHSSMKFNTLDTDSVITAMIYLHMLPGSQCYQ